MKPKDRPMKAPIDKKVIAKIQINLAITKIKEDKYDF